MGCDYFISYSLELIYTDGSYQIIELETSRRWYQWYGYDNDSSDDEEMNQDLYHEYIRQVLTPLKDKIIYDNKNFIKEKFKIKYSQFLEDNVITMILKEKRTS